MFDIDSTRRISITEFRKQIRRIRLGVPRIDAAGRHFTAVYSIRTSEADPLFGHLTDEPVGGPGLMLSGGWKTHFFFEGELSDGKSFLVAIDTYCRYWCGPTCTPGDQLIRPGLLEQLETYLNPTPGE